MAGIYAEDGSMNVTVVGGGTPVGSTAPDGSRNVTIINEATPQEAAAALGTFFTLEVDGVQASHTGDTNETVLKTVTIPGGSLGPNGIIRVTAILSNNNSANNKIFRARLGGLSGTIVFADTVTTSTSIRYSRMVHNRNSEAVQIAYPSGVGGWGSSGSALITGTVNTSVDQDLVLTVLLANAADSGSVETFMVEVLYRE